MKNKATLCEYGDLRESLIRDDKVFGIYNEAYRARLLCESDLPLAKCVDICRATEVSENNKSSHKEPMVAVAVYAVSRKRLSGKPEKTTRSCQQTKM